MSFPIPAGACDTHMHFYDSAIAAAPDTPMPGHFDVPMYREIQRRLGIERVIIDCRRDRRWALARSGSIAGASRELKIDHSTVSRRLAAIEQSLGATLVIRGSKEFAWTAEGDCALRAAQAIETQMLDMLRTIRSAKLEIGGSIRITCPSGLVALLAKLLHDINTRLPSLAVEVSGDNRTVDLARGDADIAVRMFRPTAPGLVCRRACDLGWGAYASRAYIARHGNPATIGDLAEHHLVLYIEAMHTVPGPRWIEDHRRGARAVTRVDNTEVARHLIAASGGIGVIPCFMADLHPDLVRIFPEPVATHTAWIVYHEAARDTARVRAAVDALVEVIEANETTFSGQHRKSRS